MWVFVRLLGCVLNRVSFCFLAWLVVCVYMFLCVFRHPAEHFLALLPPLDIFVCFLVLSGALGFHCNTWGSTLPALVDNFSYFSYFVNSHDFLNDQCYTSYKLFCSPSSNLMVFYSLPLVFLLFSYGILGAPLACLLD